MTALKNVILPPLLNLKKDDIHFVFDFACNKIFKADIIHRQNVHFDEDKRTWEDRTFLLRHLKHCKNYYCMEQCFYNYYFTPNSLSQRYTTDYFRIILENFRDYRELFEDCFDFDTQYVCSYWSRSIENMIFRSLEQTENTELIRQNILGTLQNDLVVHWFSRRDCVSDFEQKTSSLITSGDYSAALALYEKEYKSRLKKNNHSKMISRIKSFLKHLTGR